MLDKLLFGENYPIYKVEKILDEDKSTKSK